MKQLLIVAHTPSPNTQALCDAAYRGATHSDLENVRCVVKTPFEAGPDDVMACDGILLGTTENLGYMSGALKDFFDRSYYGVIEEKQGLPCALYIRAGLTVQAHSERWKASLPGCAGDGYSHHSPCRASGRMILSARWRSWGSI